MDHWIKTTGIIDYKPTRDEKRANGDWCIARVDKGITHYYHKQLMREIFNPFNQSPSPQNISSPKYAHATVLDGRQRVPNEKRNLIGKYQNYKVELEYSPNFKIFWRYIVLPVRCAAFDSIRYELGLPKAPFMYHITVAKIEDIDMASELFRSIKL
jgi:hypothetical protein